MSAGSGKMANQQTKGRNWVGHSTCCFARGRDQTGSETSVVSRLGGTIGWGLGANWATDMAVAVRSLPGKLRDLQMEVGCGGKGLREGGLRRRGSVWFMRLW